MTKPHVPLFRSRRDFLRLAGGGIGAWQSPRSLAERPGVGADPFTPKKPHFEAKAKTVIFLFMEGGPSHIDLFDPKPELHEEHGKQLPARFGTVVTPMGTGGNTLLATKRKFAKHGKTGLDVSDWLPHTAKCADDLCILRACWADGLNHVGSRLPDEHRLGPRRPAVPGVVGALRPRHAQPQPAGVRRDDRRPGGGRPAGRATGAPGTCRRRTRGRTSAAGRTRS